MKIISRDTQKIFFAALLFLAPCAAHAATLSATVESSGNTATIAVSLDTEGDSINTVEGSISIPRDLSIGSVLTGGSALSLWPAAPRYVPASGTIEFTGGVPGGVPAGKKILLFTITAIAPSQGTYTLAPKAVYAYKNDGKGSRIAAATSPIIVSITGKESAASVPAKDTTPPQFVSLEIGRDPSLFGGAYYVSFFAQDAQSGVARYEIKEGMFGKYVPADTYYVLKDQTLSHDVWVRATDAAGNKAVQKIRAPHTSPIGWLYPGGGILVLLGAFFFVRGKNRRRRRLI